MLKETSSNIKRILLLIGELEQYSSYKEDFIKRVKGLAKEYQLKEYDYFEYEKKLRDVLKGKTTKEWLDYYNSQICSLLKEIEYENSKIYYTVYSDNSDMKLKVHKPSIAEQTIAFTADHIAAPFVRLGKWFKRLPKPEKKKVPVPVPAAVAPAIVKRPSLFARIRGIFAAKKKLPALPFEKVIGKKEVIKPLILKKPFLSKITDSIYSLFTKKEKVISRKTELGKSLLDLELLREKEVKAAVAKLIKPGVLAEEAERVAAVLKKREKKIILYRPSTMGAIANLTVRKFSLFFIRRFPVFFEQLYRNLRLANIRVLSNTYVNMMFFFSLLSLIAGGVFFSLFFASILKGIAGGLIVAVFIFTMFYYYPVSEIRTRTRSVKTNMPFAINHMSAVINSGVAPTEMFGLIAGSKEYGEIVIEVEKIVEFIDLFGYDLTTAIETVASTTPEKSFKDFLDGMVTTISAGGDIKSYLREKADAAMHDYELERQKYVETISTYSDVYTGILIAAPLFFITTLALVSMLGGTIFGLTVDFIVAVGTYFVIPVLNIAFIVFLELTQPMV